jgi:hypothetical protein
MICVSCSRRDDEEPEQFSTCLFCASPVCARCGYHHHAGCKIVTRNRAMRAARAAQCRSIAIRPKVVRFPYLAEVRRQAGVTRDFVVSATGESVI